MLKAIKYLALALYKPNQIELGELGRSVGRINHAIAVEKGEKEYRLGQLAYALRHAVEAHHGWPQNPKLPYMTRVKLLRFLDTPGWKNTNELSNNIAENSGSAHFDKRIDSTNSLLFNGLLKDPLVTLSEIFLYSPKFKESTLAKILPLVKGQNAIA